MAMTNFLSSTLDTYESMPWYSPDVHVSWDFVVQETTATFYCCEACTSHPWCKWNTPQIKNSLPCLRKYDMSKWPWTVALLTLAVCWSCPALRVQSQSRFSRVLNPILSLLQTTLRGFRVSNLKEISQTLDACLQGTWSIYMRMLRRQCPE